MLPLYICEDNILQRKMLERIIENEIMTNGLNMKISLSTGNPMDILEALEKNPKEEGIYILDVELEHEICGIELAKRIREIDVLGKIIFVTVRRDLAEMIFIHKIEAMDYIVKDNLEDMAYRIKECLKLSNHQLNIERNNKNFLWIKSGSETYVTSVEDIIYFEYIYNRRICLYTKDNQFEFSGSIKKLEEENMDFFYCHKSFVINVKKVKTVFRKDFEVEMVNGDVVPVSMKKMKLLLDRI